MVNIGIDARLTHYRVGGISTYTTALIEALKALDSPHNFTVFNSRKAQISKNPLNKEIGLWTPPHHRIERIALSLELMRFGLDVFHATDFIPPYFGAKRHIITVHDLTFLHYPQHKDRAAQRYYNDQIEYAVKHADHILAVSSATKTDLITMLNVPESKITVQHHGVDSRFKPLSSEIVEETCYRLSIPVGSILHVGTLEPRKNIPSLLSAYQQLPNELQQKHALVLIGKIGWLFDDTMAQIMVLQENGANIILRDTVSDDDLSAVYNSATVFVIPSMYEGFGLPALEAMACGTPVIVGNNSSLPEVVGDVGLLFDASNVDDLCATLEFALKNENWRTQTSKQGIERAATFTWARSAEIALSVYTALS
ncbi:MAG: glycosyltransferase family 1 protein [Aggregatilineales bacterium]